MFIAIVRQIVRQKNKRIIKTRYSSEFHKYIKGRLIAPLVLKLSTVKAHWL